MTSQFKFDESGNISQVAAVSMEDLRDRQMITGDMFADSEPCNRYDGFGQIDGVNVCRCSQPEDAHTPAVAGWVHQYLLANGEWETVTDDNENPVTYPDRMTAAVDMVDHIAACEDAVTRGDMSDFDPEQWRIWLIG